MTLPDTLTTWGKSVFERCYKIVQNRTLQKRHLTADQGSKCSNTALVIKHIQNPHEELKISDKHKAEFIKRISEKGEISVCDVIELFKKVSKTDLPRVQSKDFLLGYLRLEKNG